MRDARKPVAKRTNNGRVLFFCPGCEHAHQVPVIGAPAWEWNQSLVAPTFRPSILVSHHPRDRDIRCHSFVSDGRIQFLGDCTHQLAGQTVDLPAWG